MPRPRITTALLITLGLVGAGCQQQQPEPEPVAPAGERVENTELGVAIAALPSFFRLVSNKGGVIELEPADAAVAGKLTVAAGPAERGGINLVQAVKDHIEDIGARPGGDYKGQGELGSHLGTAFYSRGHYQSDDGATEEETTIFLAHPLGDRKLMLIYRYPPGEAEDTRARL